MYTERFPTEYLQTGPLNFIVNLSKIDLLKCFYICNFISSDTKQCNIKRLIFAIVFYIPY